MKGLCVRVVVLFFCAGIVLIISSQFFQDNRHVGAKISSQNGEEQYSRGVGTQKPAVPDTEMPNTSTQKARPEPPGFMIPSDQELVQLDEIAWMKIYWRYINMLQVLCKDIIRVGSLKDGGKEICVDEPYRPQAPCIVYSFGINYQWDFDKTVSRTFGCQVFSFDPSMANDSYRVTDNIWFYKVGLGPSNVVNAYGWRIHTLDNIIKSLGHENRTIDILKIDVEGDEWLSLLQMISVGALDNVKQISMETHFSRTRSSSQKYWGNEASSKPLTALRRLYEIGFRIFMRERNVWSFQPWPGIDGHIANVNEISLIKI